MTPAELSAAIRACLEAAVADGALDVPVPDDVRVERPKQREHGDWSTNIALQLAKAAGRKPREVATILAERLGEVAGVKSVDVAGPGFLNVVLDAAAAGELARGIVEAGALYGRSDASAGHRVNLEFVSANPTGPIHLGGRLVLMGVGGWWCGGSRTVEEDLRGRGNGRGTGVRSLDTLVG